jgi:hypothetical protein
MGKSARVHELFSLIPKEGGRWRAPNEFFYQVKERKMSDLAFE